MNKVTVLPIHEVSETGNSVNQLFSFFLGPYVDSFHGVLPSCLHTTYVSQLPQSFSFLCVCTLKASAQTPGPGSLGRLLHHSLASSVTLGKSEPVFPHLKDVNG